MAFWGVEVKTGRPFTHLFDSVRGRLRISQATLGIGSATKRSLVQCNVGNKSPVLLCSLLPDKTESCSLDLEFEEADEVIFSVIGPRSVHLTGYYLRNGGHSNLNEDTDSYGEDIGNSESGESNRQSEEDEYEDSFIDDGDPEAYPPSPLSNVASEKTSNDIKPKNRNGRKRLKKKYQMSESDNDDNPRQQKVVNRRNGSIILESEDEDSLPISSLYKTENTVQNRKLGEGEKDDKKKTGDRGKEKEENRNFLTKTDIKTEAVAVNGEPERQTGLPFDSLKPSSEVIGPEIDVNPKKKRKEHSKEKKALEDCSLNNINVLEEDKTKQDEASNGMGPDPPLKNQQNQAAKYMGDGVPHACSLPSIEISPENDSRPKKKRRKKSEEEKTLKVDNVLKEDKGQQEGAKANNICQDQSLRKEPHSTPANDKTLINGADHFDGEKQSEEKKIKKKKKSKTQENDENVNTNIPPLSTNEMQRSVMDMEGENSHAKSSQVMEGENSHAKSSQVRMISDGLTVEELKMGKPHSTPANDKTLINGADHFAGEKQSEEKKIKKKKKSKTRENDENVNTNIPPLSTNEMQRSVMDMEGENSHAKSSQVRTLSNGLTVEELEMGKPDGKVASQGKKLSVRFIGKLKENGHIFDSNIDGAPHKFRLGMGRVIEGWDIGLDGMRVGDKRRLTIPPSMGYGSEGDNENVPPNSWLVYDVELIGAR